MTEPPMVSSSGRGGWRKLLGAAVLLCFFAFAALALARSWTQVRPALAHLSIGAVGLAILTVLLALFTSFLSWRAILNDYGAKLPLAGGLRVFFLGQLGKYLPGSVWPMVAQMELGREFKVPRRVSAAVVAISMLLVLGTALLVAAVSLPYLGRDALHRYWWTMAALPIAAILLYPSILNRLVALALRLMRREPMATPLSQAGIAKAVGWSLVAWELWGLHIWVLAVGVRAGGANLLWRAPGIFAAAWALGFVLVLVPVGAVVREAALILLLSRSMSVGQATVVALASRVLVTAGDLGWGLIALLAERRRRHPLDESPPVGVTKKRSSLE